MIQFNRLFRRHTALPSDHGSWVFLLSPLLVGLLADGRWSTVTIYVVVAALCGFLVRQPVAVAIKAYSGRRPRSDLPAAYFWIVVYSLIGLLHVLGLVLRGFGYVLYLALPGLPILAWYLFLVARRAERQLAVELVGSGVLALSAPAALWVDGGGPDPRGWWLWVLIWSQSAASIVYIHLRLEQRRGRNLPGRRGSVRMGRRALLYSSFNLIAAAALSALGLLPALLPLPYALQWLETGWGTLFPAGAVAPQRIGSRQLLVSVLFTILFLLAWRA
jgi:hypothetical protein